MSKILHAVTQHVNYMHKLKLFLEDRGPNISTSAHECEFGKLYYGGLKECLRERAENAEALKLIDKLDQLHHDFHKHSQCCADAKFKGLSFQEAETAMMQISTKLINHFIAVDEIYREDLEIRECLK